jgi:type VII secretion-associated serine protease mycosin
VIRRVAALLLGFVATVALPVPAHAAQACRLPATRHITDLPWSSRRLALDRVWPLTEGAGIVVGVVDTGVDPHHPMLAGRVLRGVDVVPPGTGGTGDCTGHGTFVAGIIGAARLPGVGFAGVAPRSTILPVRQTGNGQDGTVDTLAAGIRAAVDGGARVVNVSITVDSPNEGLAAAVRYARQRDVLVVAAAGNDAANGNPDLYPASYPGVLGVGAIGPDGNRTNFSEAGTGTGVVAPGADLLGPGAGGDGLVTGHSGTSFAAPFVAGVAALVRAYRPDLTATQVLHRIEVTADRPPGALPDPRYGWGVVNPYQAVSQLLPEEDGASPAVAAPPVPVVPAPGPPARHLDPATATTAGGVAVAALVGFAAIVRRRRVRRE